LSLESGPEESALEPDYLIRGEQILTFEDEESADRLMRQLSGDRSCGLVINQIGLGDEAFSVTSRTKEAKIDERRAVIVRERTAVAIYWDRHIYPESGATKPALATLAEHEANARTMAARLCALGYCADPVYRPVPPGKTLIYWSAAANEGTGRPRWTGISAPGKGDAVDQPSQRGHSVVDEARAVVCAACVDARRTDQLSERRPHLYLCRSDREVNEFPLIQVRRQRLRTSPTRRFLPCSDVIFPYWAPRWHCRWLRSFRSRPVRRLRISIAR
jgi:hypothetical protein